MFTPPFAVAIFPFLKTSGPITIGGQTFRSTDDIEGLDPAEAKAVTELAQMLFVNGDLRVTSASYTLVHSMDIHGTDNRLVKLARIRAVLCYLYGAPHEVFGYVALSPEQISLAVFIPDRVSVHITRPGHHTSSIGEASRTQPDSFGNVAGYRGLYNFRHYFWLEPETRLYAPTPNLTLNVQQDLRRDLLQDVPHRPDYHILPAILDRPLTPTALRIYAALDWFNRANESDLELDRSVLNLAVAFEALLGLPDGSKTERLVDAIALLMGRIDRLESWAEQFYQARSRVVHEGRLGDPHFYLDQGSGRQAIYGSLMLYGRQIFRLCLCTLLVGMDVAERADLQEKLVSNRERYERICQSLDAAGKSASERLLAIESSVRSLQRYHFMAESGYPLEVIVGAVQRASTCLLDSGHSIPAALRDALKAMAECKRSEGTLARLKACDRLQTELKGVERADMPREIAIVADLVSSAWTKVAPNFLWLQEEASHTKPPVSGEP